MPDEMNECQCVKCRKKEGFSPSPKFQNAFNVFRLLIFIEILFLSKSFCVLSGGCSFVFILNEAFNVDFVFCEYKIVFFFNFLH